MQKPSIPRIGVLALQGCVNPHLDHIEAAKAIGIAIKRPSQLNEIDGLIIPGGESTTFLKLLKVFNFFDALQKFRNSQKPIWGICAGSILMATDVKNPSQDSLGWFPIEIERNAFGRQLDSFVTHLLETEVAFIRAPRIRKILSPQITTIANHEGEPVFCEFQNLWVSTFHPELSADRPSRFHVNFIKKAKI